MMIDSISAGGELVLKSTASVTKYHVLSCRWPDVWVGKDSGGRRWLAERDLHSSGLTSLLVGERNEIVAHKHSQHSWETVPLYATPKPLEWTVELALGYPFGVRPSTNYSGLVLNIFSLYVQPQTFLYLHRIFDTFILAMEVV